MDCFAVFDEEPGFFGSRWVGGAEAPGGDKIGGGDDDYNYFFLRSQQVPVVDGGYLSVHHAGLVCAPVGVADDYSNIEAGWVNV